MLVWPLRIALEDMCVRPVRLIFEVMALATLLALLVSLASLGEGIVRGFATSVLDTPEGRRIFVTPRSLFSRTDVEWLRAQPETGFVEPNGLNVNSDRLISVTSGAVSSVRMLPTGPGDPYLGPDSRIPGPGEVLLGEDLQLAFSLSVGDKVSLDLPEAGYAESTQLELEVVGFVDLGGWVSRGMLVPSDLALAIDTRVFDESIDLYSPKDGYGTSIRNEFPSLRLYARTDRDVLRLVEKINARGLLSQPREKLVEERIALDRVVEIVFRLILVLTGVTIIIVFFSIMVGRALRLKRSMTVLQIQGFPVWGVWLVVAGQSLLLQLATLVAGFALTLVVVRYLNTKLPELLNTLSVIGVPAILTPEMIIVCLCLFTGLAALAAVTGAILITQSGELTVDWTD